MAAVKRTGKRGGAWNAIPPLQNGDRLTRTEFERRYEAMPYVKKAELVDGVVYMPSPVSLKEHAEQQLYLGTWLGLYHAHTPGTGGGDNSTLRMDGNSEPQPDLFLRILPECGGQSRNDGKYVGGAPELIAEVTASSVSYDLHVKLEAYPRNRVREYLVWRVRDRAFDWFVLRSGRYVRLAERQSGIYESKCFPGLWLDTDALLSGALLRVVNVLQEAIASPKHTAFVKSCRGQEVTC